MKRQTDTKNKLMETAITLIWQSSYSNVGVAEICKQAGVTKGGFYHYFESKADLFYDASMYFWENLKKDLDDVFSPSRKPVEQLHALIDLILYRQSEWEHVDDNPVSGCPFFTSAGQVGADEEKIRMAAQQMSEKAIQYNISMIRGLLAENVLNTREEPELLARLLYQLVQGILLYGRVMRSIDTVKTDLPAGIYRILDVKQEFRAC